MNSRSSGGKLEEFFNGKGFYIVLFLCAAVIGASAWMMAAGDRAMKEEISVMKQDVPSERVETIIVPPVAEETLPVQVTLPEETAQETEPEAEAPEAEAVWSETVPMSSPLYLWPVSGTVERRHDLEVLHYDVTMQDWRTHAGIDIAAPLGSPVNAAHAGSVVQIAQDDLYGTVVTVDHGDGMASVYANLAEEPAVAVGDWAEPGSVIGAVGSSALCEVGQEGHLHFALTVNGAAVDPLSYLPA